MSSTIDVMIPDWDFRQLCSRWIAAPQEVVWDTLIRVSITDLRVTRVLMAIRHPGEKPTGRSLFAGGPMSLLEVDQGRAAIAGRVTKAWQLRPVSKPVRTLTEFNAENEPGWVKFLTDFRLASEGDGTRLSTETRGICTDARTRRIFLVYWAAIKPGAEIVRRDILSTVGGLAEGRGTPYRS